MAKRTTGWNQYRISSRPDVAAVNTSISTDVLIESQRKTVAEHIRHEQVKDWPAVYRTFTTQEDEAYYDVVPFQMRFRR